MFFLGACSFKKIEFDTQSGKTNTVKVGEKFRVTLPGENHQQNYYWLLIENSNKRGVTYLGSVFHGDKSGEVDFNFFPRESGETTLTFNLNHFNDSTQTKVFKVTVIK
ncbi:MAG TPA: protease inhibitor I42 family protein [Bacteroidia bacterium]|nr:protease inhibitor I42 family protein [Bacteroidia bacterium]